MEHACLIPPRPILKPSIPSTWAICHVFRSSLLAEAPMQAQVQQHSSYGCQGAFLYLKNIFYPIDGPPPNKMSCMNKKAAHGRSGWSAISRLWVHLYVAVCPKFVCPVSFGSYTVCSGSTRGGPRTEKKKKKGGKEKKKRKKYPNPHPTPNPKMDGQDLSLNFWKTKLHCCFWPHF